MKINAKKFFESLRQEFGSLKQNQVDAINQLLAAIAEDKTIVSLEQMAYVFATVYHETAHTFEPIAEIGNGRGKTYGVKDRQTKQTYYGRGYAQLTWRKNYEQFSDLLDVDLVNNPDLAMQPDIAFQILSLGMGKGLFTKKKLADFINQKECDYFNARKIVNGLDKAALIETHAEKFEKVLRDSTGQEKTLDLTTNEPKAVEMTKPPATDNASAAQAVTVVQGSATETPQSQIVSAPTDTPIEATNGGFKSWMASVVSWITGAGAGIVALVKDNQTLLIIAAIVVVVAGLCVFIRQLVLDRERLKLAADPTKYTVR